MVMFEYKGKSFHMDNRLDRDLRTKVYPDLLKHDKDNVFLIDGNEGSGKSKFADILGAHAAANMKCDYDIDSVCLSPEEFRNRIQDCPDKSIVIYDEAHRGMGSKRALSEINNILVDLMMEMRQKNLFVLIVMPTFFLLEKYAALFRSKGLFHVYERKRKRGFWVFFNEENKKKLYVLGKKLLSYNVMKYPAYRGRFFNQWSIDEVAYRAKKLKTFQTRTSLTKAEKFKDQRDLLMKILFDELRNNGISKAEYTRYLKQRGINLQRTQVNDILNGKYTKDDGDSRNDDGNDMEIDGKDEENMDLGVGDGFKNTSITIQDKESDDFSPEEEDFDEKDQENQGM